MTSPDRIVIVALFLLVAVLVFGRQGPESGRRPLMAPPMLLPRPPLGPQPSPETVPRHPPPLRDPGLGDPVVEVDSDEPRHGTLLLGTGFSVDARGVWITARHVASGICGEVIMIVDGRQVSARIAYLHPDSDLAILRTTAGAPALPLSSERLALDQTGFSFGYPTGVLGATQDRLMGRSRMHLGGRLSGMTPVLTWAETRRFPDTLEALGGMSGGPMLDAHGRVIGVVVAATTRRGRIHTVAPELLREVEGETALFGASPTAAAPPDIADGPDALSAAASGLSQRSRIAKIYCRVR
jgi:serine protease Do